MAFKRPCVSGDCGEHVAGEVGRIQPGKRLGSRVKGFGFSQWDALKGFKPCHQIHFFEKSSGHSVEIGLKRAW